MMSAVTITVAGKAAKGKRGEEQNAEGKAEFGFHTRNKWSSEVSRVEHAKKKKHRDVGAQLSIVTVEEVDTAVDRGALLRLLCLGLGGFPVRHGDSDRKQQGTSSREQDWD